MTDSEIQRKLAASLDNYKRRCGDDLLRPVSVIAPEMRRAAFLALCEWHDNVPPVMVALTMALFKDQMVPARFNADGYQIFEECKLRDLLPAQYASELEKWLRDGFAPHRPCDECHKTMSRGVPADELPLLQPVVLSAWTPTGFKWFFLCDWCAEKWECYSGSPNLSDGLPNIVVQLERGRA